MQPHVIPAERAIVIEADHPEHLLAMVPSAFVLEPGLVGMPHDVDTAARLTRMGVLVSSPIQHYYQFPHDATIYKKIFEHQLITAGFLCNNPHAYCLNSIGTMKTITALWAADYLMSQGIIRRALIVAPRETLERAWGDTLFVHLTHRSFAVLSGAAARRKNLLAQPHDFYIVNPDGLPVIQKELAKRDDLDLYIIDELADFRNKTDNWKALEALIYPDKRPPVPWVWGMTGTPRPQAATDPYHQCRLVTPTTVPKYASMFRALTMSHESTYIWIERPEAQKIIHECMRPAIRYTRDECLDLPGEIHTTYDVVLSAEQTKHYKEIMRDLFTEIQGGKINAVNEGVKRSKLLQIACGVVYDSKGVPHEIDAGSRVEVLLSTIEHINEKVIVFVPFTEVTNTLIKAISKHWSAAVVYGDVPAKERDQIFADFQQKDDPSVLVAHPGCMSRGLTLTEASTIIWYAPVDSNYTYEQANGRITRQGQKYVANIIHLAGSAIERKMYKRLELRQKMQGALLDMVKNGESLL